MLLRFVRVLGIVVLLGAAANATPSVLDFEGFSDGTILTTQYSGVTFSNAIIFTAGTSLNELEFPPHSGVNVASDNGGAMSIDFASPVSTFGGYFTYTDPLTIDAYDTNNNLSASVMSAFSGNEAVSGDPGSSPNEVLMLSSAMGISSVTIIGNPAGGSFVLDDATYVPVSVATPEPSYFGLHLLSVSVTAIVLLLRRRALPRFWRWFGTQRFASMGARCEFQMAFHSGVGHEVQKIHTRHHLHREACRDSEGSGALRNDFVELWSAYKRDSVHEGW